MPVDHTNFREVADLANKWALDPASCPCDTCKAGAHLMAVMSDPTRTPKAIADVLVATAEQLDLINRTAERAPIHHEGAARMVLSALACDADGYLDTLRRARDLKAPERIGPDADRMAEGVRMGLRLALPGLVADIATRTALRLCAVTQMVADQAAGGLPNPTDAMDVARRVADSTMKDMRQQARALLDTVASQLSLAAALDGQWSAFPFWQTFVLLADQVLENMIEHAEVHSDVSVRRMGADDDDAGRPASVTPIH